MSLNQAEILRYSRHLPLIGLEGQQKLKMAKVLCVGSGGLGCSAMQYLVASGVGHLGIVDGDNVELSNLQRQILFSETDIGQNKAMVAANYLSKMNSHVSIQPYAHFFSTQHTSLIAEHDVIMDATDNYETRYALNQVCRAQQKPLISASIYQFRAQISVFNYQQGPCYQCLYPEPPSKESSPNCALGGVLGVLPGVVGALQATEAIKVILGFEHTLSGTLLTLDLQQMQFQQFTISKQDCSKHPNFSSESVPTIELPTITPQRLSELLTSHQNLQLIDVREPYERNICHIGGILSPLLKLEQEALSFDKEKMTVIYCKSGSRSAKACQLLINAGFMDVCYLEGGILKWQEIIDERLMKY